MATGEIKCGICGFEVKVEAEQIEGSKVKLNITSTCPSYQKIAAELQEVDAYQEIFQKLHQGKVYEVFSKYSKHPSCPGISGILKTIEVAAGLALGQSASMEIRK
ncbi:DUF6951 family protein [Paradesulfitobacterium ferrireducens]|uniref:DUF6951 family protein n=1 Tax=Paradesulfitobacterium ferrireducens TaxID=2816476 RepID=UPI001A902927|nr:hypothetical protein [Paradesulfitobacterium ferrireducens]